MRTVGYISEEGAEQEKEPVTEQTGTPATPEPPADTVKKGGKKE